MSFFKKKQSQSSHITPPSHIAIIMDGNARWAKAKNVPLQVGHKKGSQNVQDIAQACIDLGVKYLTIYAFSSENWDRPASEVSCLMQLLENYLEKETKPLIEKNVCIMVSGDLNRLSKPLQDKINHIQNITKNNQSLTLNVAFSYGSRQEIVNAVKNISLAVKEGKITVDDIDEALFSQHLYQKQIPDPDLLIRTAGDYRISNFLLWQIAYSELYFTQVYWPDFNKNHLIEAIATFNQRERRYGKR